VLSAADVTLDLRTRRAMVGGREVHLSVREFRLAETFIRYRGEVLSREELLWRVWGADSRLSSNIVEVYVGYLRRKLGKRSIETVKGAGYRFRP
jgi:two-component system, OmpR family, response regulator QseB